MDNFEYYEASKNLKRIELKTDKNNRQSSSILNITREVFALELYIKEKEQEKKANYLKLQK